MSIITSGFLICAQYVIKEESAKPVAKQRYKSDCDV
jgi:hypothetical protein